MNRSKTTLHICRTRPLAAVIATSVSRDRYALAVLLACALHLVLLRLLPG
jgi:hypothetical protein